MTAANRKPDECLPVGPAEIADALGVSTRTVYVWQARGIFPEPRWTVSNHPAWNWADVKAWAKATGRL